MSSTTGCECSQKGFCNRHECNKSSHYVHLCQTDQRYFNLWEAGDGPCLGSNPGKSSGIGDTIAKLLRKVGIKKRKGCGCSKRQAKLNQWWKFRK